jgi:hypothetical protein
MKINLISERAAALRVVKGKGKLLCRSLKYACADLLEAKSLCLRKV